MFMNDNQIDPTESLAEARSTYLRTKAGSWTNTLAMGFVTLASLSISVAAILGLALNTIGFGREVRDVCAECAVWLSDPYAINWIIPLIMVTGAITFVGAMWAHSQVVEIEELPRVPSVIEQIAILPPSEILVRASEHPDGVPAELLRALPQRYNINPAEMLRTSEQTEVQATAGEVAKESSGNCFLSVTSGRAAGTDDADSHGR
jgi:hypothetical protein